MRALPARRIATSALCATLLLGISGPAAVAAGDGPARVHTHAAAPVPGADALLTQVQSLANISGVLAPVTDLLSAALKAEGGQLPAADAAKLSQAVKDAIAKATAALPAVPAAPSVPTLPSTPALPATPAVPSLKNSDERGDSEARGDVEGRRMTAERRHAGQAGSQDDKAPRAKGARAAANLAADALVALQKAVDTLVKAVTSGDATQVVPAATAVVTGLVNFVVAVVLGGGLPAPNLPGLPALPSLPAT
ncbi:hypothetical protein ABT275_28710 [Streptomyces sp. NPDC001185]|uniref:hypothetical protein n=1 Tax=Streptomyces sp. NPDC001185 TaxID=3154380 RepID=UPI003334646A